MKVFNQIGILLGVWAAGELVSQFIKNIISIPGSILGMIILFLLLQFKVISEEKIKDVADFLLGNMAFFFVPAGVSIINYFDILKSTVLQLLVICVVSTIVTFAVTAYAVTLTVKLMEKKKGGKKA